MFVTQISAIMEIIELRIKNMRLSVIFKLALVMAALLGILIQIGLFSGELHLSVLNYFTLMSNILCLVYFFAAMVHEANRGGTLLPTLKGAVVLGITVTGLVYHFMLSGSFQMQGSLSLSSMLLHYAVPVMAVMDWLLFSEKGRYSRKSPFIWLLVPDGYFIYAVIRVALGASLGYGGNRYPYPFINVDALGWRQVLINGAVLNLFFVVLGLVFVIIDHLMARKAAAHDI
jgi:hypothetical protein